MKRIRDWTEFKKYLDRGLSPQEIADDDNEGQVNIILIDGFLKVYFRAYKGNETDDTSTEWTEYKNNYQANANKTFTDSNGIPLARTKITKSGWHYQAHGTEFVTAKLNSVFNEDANGNDLGLTTIKYYDNNNVELVAGTQAELDANCVKTVFSWESDQDIDVIGGILEQPVPPTKDVRVWVIAIPDLPAANGGSVPFTQGGVNLRYISGSLDIDGKTAKTLPYDSTYHTSKFEIIVKHDTGYQTPIHMIFNLFRENV